MQCTGGECGLENEDFVAEVVCALESPSVRYFISGSIASMAYSEVRFTADVDLVVLLSQQQASALAKRFPLPNYYCDKDALIRLGREGGMNNIIDNRLNFKADLIQSRMGVSEEQVFDRLRRLPITETVSAWFSSPEDVISSKLEAYAEGKYEKHLRDIASMLVIQGDNVDRQYVDRWSAKLSVDNLWMIAHKRADQVRSGRK